MSGQRPPNEGEIYARLEARAQAADMRVCNECMQCATRCTDGIELTCPEFARLMGHLESLPEEDVAGVLAQDKRFHWGEGAVVEMCPFLDMDTHRCLVYEARPLICRLFGYAAWLPCPTGDAATPLPDALAVMREYADLERRTLRQRLLLTSGEHEAFGRRVKEFILARQSP